MIPITWVGAPAHWAEGRSRAIQYVVVHQTQGSEGVSSAEDGADYDKRRPDSVSCHIFVDTNSAVREVRDQDTAFSAYTKGNALGIHVELCHLGAWSLAEPNDAATFDNAAQVVAQLCLAHAIPAVHLTVAQVRAAWYGPSKPKGICGHYDVTRAYPEDGGDHTDPDISGGKPTGFNWAEFIHRVAGYMGGAPALPDRQESTMRYTFDASFTDRPAELVSPGGYVIVATSGVGDYFVHPVSYQFNECVDDASGIGVKVLTRGGGHHQVPASWSFATAFAYFTGGCTFDPDKLAGLAPWRQVAVAGGDVILTDVQVSGSLSGTVSGSVSGGVSGSFSGNTTPVAQP